MLVTMHVIVAQCIWFYKGWHCCHLPKHLVMWNSQILDAQRWKEITNLLFPAQEYNICNRTRSSKTRIISSATYTARPYTTLIYTLMRYKSALNLARRKFCLTHTARNGNLNCMLKGRTGPKWTVHVINWEKQHFSFRSIRTSLAPHYRSAVTKIRYSRVYGLGSLLTYIVNLEWLHCSC